jgi:hypothetical protein
MQASKKAANAQDFALPSIACQQVAELQPSTIRGIADQLRHLRHQAGSALQELFMRCSSVVVEGLKQFPRLGMMMNITQNHRGRKDIFTDDLLVKISKKKSRNTRDPLIYCKIESLLLLCLHAALL